MYQYEEPLSITKHPDLIDKKFEQILSKKTLNRTHDAPQPKQLRFRPDETHKIKKDFEAICSSNQLSFEEFRASLGLFGSEDFFIRRLFDILDDDGNGKITVDNYYEYLDVLFNGTDFERANFGWKLITGNKSYMELKDLHQLFSEIALMWNAITGEVVTPRREYVQQIFSLFDLDQDETITFEDYQVFFSEQNLIFGWFEFLNNFPLEKTVLKVGFKQNRARLERKKRNTVDKFRKSTKEEDEIKKAHKEDLLRKKFGDLCKQLLTTSKMACDQLKGKAEVSPFLDLSQKTDHSFLSRAHEPVVLLRSQTPEDREDTAEYLDLLPQSKRYLMRARVDLPDKDTSGKMINELKLCLEKVTILQRVCRELKDQEYQQKSVAKRKKQLEVKLEMVNKQMTNEMIDASEAEEPAPKKNLAVYFGHENWNLVLNLMVGMRQSIKSLHELSSEMELKDSHFSEKQSFVLSNKVYKVDERYYKFEDYGPLVFEKLRLLEGIKNRSFQLSVGPEVLIGKLAMGNLTAISEKFSTGKSGAFFYETQDGKYLLKTISKSECNFLIKILRNYHQHLCSNPHSLIVRIFGLYKLKQFKNKTKLSTIRFIAMENIFSQRLKPIAIYDLKGSSYDRRGDQHEFKDLDWTEHRQKISLPKFQRDLLVRQVRKDVLFFSSNNINDYSILLGMFQPPKNKEEEPLSSKSVFRCSNGGCLSRKGDTIYIMSIIDILTEFGFRKNTEFLFKRVFLGEGVSCVPPQEYGARFSEFVEKALEKEDE